MCIPDLQLAPEDLVPDVWEDPRKAPIVSVPIAQPAWAALKSGIPNNLGPPSASTLTS